MQNRVFWLVGAGLKVRHAVSVHPGALPHGEFVPAACERWIKLPFSTPYDRVPASKAIRVRCDACVAAIAPRGLVEVTWDS